MSCFPKISIVTPSYNQAEFLEETLQSVITQNYIDLEYVVIDGGSTDNSQDIIKKYEGNLKYWVSEQDNGHGDALNKGFAHTTGDIMAWINSDDKYTPWTFKAVANIFTQNPDVMWIMGIPTLWNEDGAMIDAIKTNKNIYDYLSGNYAWIQQESVFWRRSLWEKAGSFINTNYQLMVDGELWSRFFLHEKLHSVHCILGGYRSYARNRAGIYAKTCHSEMRQAIIEMKKHCNQDILVTQSKLEKIRHQKKHNIFNSTLSIFQQKRSCDLSVLKEAEYDIIVYDGGSWRKRKLPYSI